MIKWMLTAALFLMLAGCAGTVRHTGQPSAKQGHTPAKAKHAVSLERMDARFLYLAYQQALEDRQYGLAIRFLKALVKKDTETLALRLELVELYLGSGQENYMKQALHEMRQIPSDVVSRLKGDALARYQLLYARTLILNDQAHQAVQLLHALLQAQPDNVQVRLLLTQHEARQGRLAQAHSLADEGIRRHKDLRLYEAKVHLLLQQQAWGKALDLLRFMQRQYPDREGVVLQRSRVLQQQNQFGRAESVLKAYIDKHQDTAVQSMAMLAGLYVRQNRFQEAISLYRRLLDLTPNTGSVYMSLGKVHYQQEDYAKAADAFARAVAQYKPVKPHKTISDTLATAYFYQAASLEAGGKGEQAKPLYRKLQPQHTFYVDAQLRLASMDMAQQAYTKAESRLLQLLKTHSEETDVYVLLSGLRLQQKAYDQLIRETEPALALPFSAPLWFNRAVAFESLKKYAQLDQTLATLLEHQPEHAEALNFYAYSLADRGVRLDDALTMIRQALKKKPDDGYYLDSLAWVYFKQGKYMQALKVQQRAIDLVPDDPVMQEHMGDIYWKAQRHQAARRHWEKALKLEHEELRRVRKKIKQGLI